MLSKSRISLLSLVILLAVFLLPSVALAQGTDPPSSLPFTNWEQFLTFGVVPLTIALVGMLKFVMPDRDRLYPIVALVLGVVFTMLAGYRLDYDPVFAFVLGVALGAAASGFYSWQSTYRAQTSP